MSSFDYTEDEYKNKMAILDQDGKNEEASIDDIRRVLKTYAKQMSDEEIEHFI